VLFDRWDQALNDEGLPAWDFGSAQQLPGLSWFNQVFRPHWDALNAQFFLVVE
jgi:hypothetical protein